AFEDPHLAPAREASGEKHRERRTQDRELSEPALIEAAKPAKPPDAQRRRGERDLGPEVLPALGNTELHRGGMIPGVPRLDEARSPDHTGTRCLSNPTSSQIPMADRTEGDATSTRIHRRSADTSGFKRCHLVE